MRDIDRDYPVYGEELWNRFRMKDKKIIGWYYIGIKDALKDAFEGVEAYEEYSRLVHKNFWVKKIMQKKLKIFAFLA